MVNAGNASSVVRGALPNPSMSGRAVAGERGIGVIGVLGEEARDEEKDGGGGGRSWKDDWPLMPGDGVGGGRSRKLLPFGELGECVE